MEATTTVQAVLKAAKENPESRKVLETLFPNAFKENKMFCKMGDIFIRKGTSSFYAIKYISGKVKVKNLTSGKFWETEIPANFPDFAKHNGTITFGELVKLSKGRCKNPFDDFKVLIDPQALWHKEDIFRNQ